MAKLADGSRASEYMKKTPWPREASMALLDGIRDLSVVETNAGTVGKEGSITTHCVANLNELYPHGVPVCPSCGTSSKSSAQKKCRVLFDKPLMTGRTFYTATTIYLNARTPAAIRVLLLSSWTVLRRVPVLQSIYQITSLTVPYMTIP